MMPRPNGRREDGSARRRLFQVNRPAYRRGTPAASRPFGHSVGPRAHASVRRVPSSRPAVAPPRRRALTPSPPRVRWAAATVHRHQCRRATFARHPSRCCGVPRTTESRPISGGSPPPPQSTRPPAGRAVLDVFPGAHSPLRRVGGKRQGGQPRPLACGAVAPNNQAGDSAQGAKGAMLPSGGFCRRPLRERADGRRQGRRPGAGARSTPSHHSHAPRRSPTPSKQRSSARRAVPNTFPGAPPRLQRNRGNSVGGH